MKRRSQSGVTLLEVLVAVSLLSLLSVGVLTSMRLGLNALGRTSNRLALNRRVAGAQRILEQQLRSFVPVVALCGSAAGPGVRTPFFFGEPQSMRFVSAYSIEEAWRGHPRILEFQVIPRDQGEGVRLVVNEHLYAGPVSAGLLCRPGAPFLPIEVGPRSFVLADRLAFCRFTYQEVLPPPAFAVWRPRWDLPRWPGAVRVEMAPLEDDLTRLRPTPVTAQIHVNRYPIFEYGDY